MSILNQLLNLVDPINEKLSQNLTSPDWVISQAALAAHQAMQDGLRGGSNIDTTLSRPALNSNGSINVAKTLQVSLNYRRLLVQQQLQDIRFKPTSNDVVDGGIKNGSKVVIKVVNENEGPIDSWDKLVRSSLEDTDGTPQNLVFDKFSVMSITEPDEQRHQIHETFGADILQTFGRRPRILTISGQVVNGRMDVKFQGETRSMDWKNAFQRYYEKHYSAHACTRKRKKVRIFAQDTIYDGYMLNLVSAVTAVDQGLAQVTITFLLSSRNFPRENDDLIPGFANENGFILSDKTIPDDYFPQARLEFIFEDDFTRVLAVGIEEAEREVQLLIDRIASLASSSNPVEGAITVSEELSNLDLVDSSRNFFYPVTDFRLHILGRGSEIEASILAYEIELSLLNSDKEEYNLAVNADTSSNEISLTNDASLNQQFQELKATEATLRAIKKGLIERVRAFNTIASKIESLEKEARNYVSLREGLEG